MTLQISHMTRHIIEWIQVNSAQANDWLPAADTRMIHGMSARGLAEKICRVLRDAGHPVCFVGAARYYVPFST